MKKALNQNNKLIPIIESVASDTYSCPICHRELIRKFGTKKQYYAHPKDVNATDCEIKMKLYVKEDSTPLQDEQIDILETEFYNKQFDDITIEMSTYKSEEGYFLTKEQENIINSTEDRIKISALAGSAKTSTLYYYSKDRPFKKILYIVYNKAMKDEAEKTFGKLRHVDIKTIHGLAFGYVGRFYKDKLTNSYGVVDIIKDLNLNWNNDMELAVKVNEMMKQYMLSDVKTFNDLELFLDDDLKDQIVYQSQKLWNLKKSYKNNIKIEHDFYLKLFQLSKTDLSDKYNIILLDEAQDSNLMMFDIIQNSKVKGVVIVGDKYQQLYGWRNAINIMPMFDAKEYTLTTSFRVSQNIAHIANLIVYDIADNNIQMKGFNSKQKIVDKIDKNKPYVCLCRTNAYIFSEIAEALSINKNKKLFFEGGYQSYNFKNLQDAYWFSLGYETKNPILSKFKDYYKMEEYAKSTEDLEILALVRMVEKYGSRIIDIVNGIKNNAVTKKENADIIFSTCHRAKGQTYAIPVFISEDHFDLEKEYIDKFINQDIDKLQPKDLNNLYGEMCIVYVAITRCSGQIELSDIIKRYLLLRYKVNKHNFTSIPLSSGFRSFSL